MKHLKTFENNRTPNREALIRNSIFSLLTEIEFKPSGFRGMSLSMTDTTIYMSIDSPSYDGVVDEYEEYLSYNYEWMNTSLKEDEDGEPLYIDIQIDISNIAFIEWLLVNHGDTFMKISEYLLPYTPEEYHYLIDSNELGLI